MFSNTKLFTTIDRLLKVVRLMSLTAADYKINMPAPRSFILTKDPIKIQLSKMNLSIQK